MAKRKNKKRTKRVTPDEVFQRGPISVARLGRYVEIRNNASPAQHAQRMAAAAAMLPTVIADIETAVKRLTDLVAQTEPTSLLHMSYFNMANATIGKTAEPDSDFGDLVAHWTHEYIQNLVAASPLSGHPGAPASEVQFAAIEKEVEKIYRLLTSGYFICLSAKNELDGAVTNIEFEKFYVQAQMYWMGVRKHRYTYHDVEHLRLFLSPHAKLFQDSYGITAEAFLIEFEKILDSLTTGLPNAVEEMREVQDECAQRIATGQANSIDESMRSLHAEREWASRMARFRGRFMGLDLFDLQEVTTLPASLLERMSWQEGAEVTFLAAGDQAGWPLRITPLRRRPFLKIAGKYFCFDYQPLVDGVYRFFQKDLVGNDAAKSTAWKDLQQLHSERVPLDILAKLLGCAQTYQSVYYQWPAAKSLDKNWCETDGLIIYDDHLLVLESKAGAFTWTSPTDDFNAHINSFKTLLDKPSQQAKRFVDYLSSAEELPIYRKLADGTYEEMTTLRYDTFRIITGCGVTLDGLALMASRADSLQALGIDLKGFPFWSISIDDLMVYRDLFTSPTTFAHFLEQRHRAIANPRFTATDEMDHVGMYFEHNAYSELTEDFPKAGLLGWNGYSASIDRYFHYLMADPSQATRPQQSDLPDRLKAIIAFLDGSQTPGRARIAGMLLDLSGDARKGIGEAIDRILALQRESGTVKPCSFFNDLSLSFICQQPAVTISDAAIDEYVFANLAWTKNPERTGLLLYYDAEDRLVDVTWRSYRQDDISPAARPGLLARAEKMADQRVFTFMRMDGKKKIGANEPCPCNSGLKYKRCHGNS